MADKDRTQRCLEAFAKTAQRCLDKSALEGFRPKRRAMAIFVWWRNRTALDDCLICFRDLPRRRIKKRRMVTT